MKERLSEHSYTTQKKPMIVSPLTDTIEDDTLLNSKEGFAHHNAHRKLKANSTIKVQR